MTDVAAHTRTVWAKSRDDQGNWLPLWVHLDDTAGVTRFLVESWMPSGTMERLASTCSVDADALRRIVRFLAGVHDIGKATPTFAHLDPSLADRMSAHGMVCDPDVVAQYRGRARHNVTGYHLLLAWLVERGMQLPAASSWAAVVGGHHGAPLTAPARTSLDPEEHPDAYGAGVWAMVRAELLERQWKASGLIDRDLVALSQPAQAAAMGLVIMADWIASNEYYFPYTTIDRADRVHVGLQRLRLPRQWTADHVPSDATALIMDRFELPDGARPRPVQRDVVDEAWEMSTPGLMVIEAPMGEGKTEAALAAAEVLAHRFAVGGVFFALPTQATTDALFGRFLSWLDRLPDDDLDVGASVALIHGKAAMNRLYQGLSSAPRAVVDADAPRSPSTHARGLTHAWLAGRKRSSLASMAVGTIDQVLFAGLRSNHLALRHLGLLGKVVVIDEVHAYDTWMSTYLDVVLEWLAADGVPVIMLSATLPPDRRASLLRAYQPGALATGTGYPVITTTTSTGTRQAFPDASGRGSAVRIEGLDDAADITRVLDQYLREGGCAVVVRNTVQKAQATADELRQHWGPDQVTLVHARFLAADRAVREKGLVERFGPPRPQGDMRPQRHVVVATQVVEQSLDLDFDLMVSDLCPIDLLLQRMGRLHRHTRDRPAPVSEPRCFVTGHTQNQDGSWDFGTSEYVYAPRLLLATLAQLQSRWGGTVALPDDIEPLVREVYTDPSFPTAWEQQVRDATERWRATHDRDRKQSLGFRIAPPGRGPIQNWGTAEVAGDLEETMAGRAAVRNATPTLEVMVVCDVDGVWVVPPWTTHTDGDVAVPRGRAPDDAIARMLGQCTISFRPGPWNNEAVEAWLWDQTPITWEAQPLIYRYPVLVLAPGQHSNVWEAYLPGDFHVRYGHQDGLSISRPDAQGGHVE